MAGGGVHPPSSLLDPLQLPARKKISTLLKLTGQDSLYMLVCSLKQGRQTAREHWPLEPCLRRSSKPQCYAKSTHLRMMVT